MVKAYLKHGYGIVKAYLMYGNCMVKAYLLYGWCIAEATLMDRNSIHELFVSYIRKPAIYKLGFFVMLPAALRHIRIADKGNPFAIRRPGWRVDGTLPSI